MKTFQKKELDSHAEDEANGHTYSNRFNITNKD